MTKQGLAQAIGLALIDKAFRTRLLKNPTSAVKGTDIKLDSREVNFLKERGTGTIIEDYSSYLSIKYAGGGKCR